MPPTSLQYYQNIALQNFSQTPLQPNGNQACKQVTYLSQFYVLRPPKLAANDLHGTTPAHQAAVGLGDPQDLQSGAFHPLYPSVDRLSFFGTFSGSYPDGHHLIEINNSKGPARPRQRAPLLTTSNDDGTNGRHQCRNWLDWIDYQCHKTYKVRGYMSPKPNVTK